MRTAHELDLVKCWMFWPQAAVGFSNPPSLRALMEAAASARVLSSQSPGDCTDLAGKASQEAGVIHPGNSLRLQGPFTGVSDYRIKSLGVEKKMETTIYFSGFRVQGYLNN